MKNKLFSLIIISAITFLLIVLFFVSMDTGKKNILVNEINTILEPNNSLPEYYELNIPFMSQAPLGDWNPPFDHACEETSVLMAYYFFENIKPTSLQVAEDINNIVNFEKERYGVYKDTTATETARLIKDYYGYNAKILFNVSITDVKKEILKGNVVIFPTDGRALKNPNFTPPGPVYHMLVVKGFDLDGFITNDPGTKRGKDYKYSYNVLMNAISDWENGHLNGKSVIISISQ